MTTAIVIVSIVLAAGWIPLAVRFLRGWRSRKNPVSLAICAALCLFAYTNALFALVAIDGASLQFLAIATHVFEVVVIANFYVAFKWSEKRFPDARDKPAPTYTVPPMNTSNPSDRA